MKFLFERDFDTELAEEQQRAEMLSRGVYSEEELAAAVAQAREEALVQGRAEGRHTGLEEARCAFEKRHLSALEALPSRIDMLIRQADEHRQALETQLVDFLLSIGQQLFPDIIESHGSDRAARKVRETLSLAVGSARLRVLLSETTLELYRSDLERVAAQLGLTERLELAAEPGLADGDTRVEWDNGFMEYSFTAICDRILTALGEPQAEPTDPNSDRSEPSV